MPNSDHALSTLIYEMHFGNMYFLRSQATPIDTLDMLSETNNTNNVNNANMHRHHRVKNDQLSIKLKCKMSHHNLE